MLTDFVTLDQAVEPVMSDPDTSERWFALAQQHEVTAQAVVTSRIAAGQAVFHTGAAVECALKAYIMHNERLHAWPSREESLRASRSKAPLVPKGW